MTIHAASRAMTETAPLPGSARLSSVTGRAAGQAFRAANRHTRHVRWARRLIIVGALGLTLGIVVFAFFNPFRIVLPDNVSVSGAGLSGSRITMQKPKMSGYRTDGRPYDFVAESAVQDLHDPTVLELDRLDAHVTMPDKTVAHITADRGFYNASKDLMDLAGDIRLLGASGYDVRMSKAHIEFKAGDVSSNEPVSVLMQTGSVTADSMAMVDNGREVTFVGRVHSVMQPADAAATPAIKGTAP